MVRPEATNPRTTSPKSVAKPRPAKTHEGARLHDNRRSADNLNPPSIMLSRQALLRAARTAAPRRVIASQARFYASPAADQNVKPPVALYGIDGTYATALVRVLKTQLTVPTTQAIRRLNSAASFLNPNPDSEWRKPSSLGRKKESSRKLTPVLVALFSTQRLLSPRRSSRRRARSPRSAT